VIASVVLDGQRGRLFLLVLDAQSFEEVGRAFAPHVMPLASMGNLRAEYVTIRPAGLTSFSRRFEVRQLTWKQNVG
jgi:hypothetical protein